MIDHRHRGVGRDAHEHHAARGLGARGVFDEISDDAFDGPLIAFRHDGMRRRVECDAPTVAERDRGIIGDHCKRGLGEVQFRHRRGRALLLNLGQHQQLFEHRLNALNVPLYFLLDRSFIELVHARS